MGMGTFSETYRTGWCCNLVNGNYYYAIEAPKFYFLKNFIFKSPEYILIAYCLFIIFAIWSNNFFTKRFEHFNSKIYFLVIILFYPDVIALIVPYPLYDGLRLFLWTIPYFF